MPKLKSVLIIDDDEIHNFILSRLIQQLDIAEFTLTLKNGQEGIGYIEGLSCASDCPGIIFLDINMPVRTGIEFLESVQSSIVLLPVINIIVISNYVHPHEEDSLRSFGVKHILLKPITRDKLIDSLKDLKV